MGRWSVIACAVSFALLGACQLIAGLETRTLADASLDVIESDASSDVVTQDAGVDAPCSKCSGTCVDLSDDPNHCGYCGHACNGCSGGVCPSTTLVTGISTDSYSFAEDAVTLYFGSNNGLQYVAKDGSDGGMLLSLEPQDIAPLNGTLYLATIVGVESVDSNGSNEQIIYQRDYDAGESLGVGVATNLPTIFWQTQSGIFSVQEDGGGLQTIVPEVGSVTAMVIDATKIYFLNNIVAQLLSVEQDGGATTELANTFAGGTSIALSNGVLYWGTQDSVYQTPLDGGASTPIATNVDTVTSVAVQDGRLFWSVEGTLPNTGSIMMMPFDGGAPAAVAKDLNQPIRLLVDTTAVYWFEAGAIKKVNW